MEQYLGWKEYKFTTDSEWSDFYNGSYDIDKFSLLNNQYLLLKNEDDEVVDKYCLKQGKLTPVKFQSIESQLGEKIKPKNIQQQLAIDMINDRKTPMKIIRGQYGSGKDFIMLNKALQLVKDEVFSKIVFVRPNLVVKDVPDIGFLKGDLYDKTSWLLSCFWDKVPYGEIGVQSLIDAGKLELVPLGFIRGRTFNDSIVYCCEFQNATLDICSLVLGRVGEHSEIWFNGDSHQTDNSKFDRDNGLNQLVEIFKGDEDFSTVFLPKSERSKIASKCEKIDEYRAINKI